MRSLEEHFVAGLASEDPDFPCHTRKNMRHRGCFTQLGYVQRCCVGGVHGFTIGQSDSQNVL
jgi:hypothetical protein